MKIGKGMQKMTHRKWEKGGGGGKSLSFSTFPTVMEPMHPL